MTATFVVGRRYTRDQIHDALGGSKRWYLPTRDGRVVCGAFTRELNPAAPRVVLVGRGPIIEATSEALEKQPGSIPVFVKHTSNAWEYRGQYRVAKRETAPDIIAEHARRGGRSGDVSAMLFFERVGD